MELMRPPKVMQEKDLRIVRAPPFSKIMSAPRPLVSFMTSTSQAGVVR